MRAVRQTDTPQLVVRVHRFDTRLRFRRGELANPGDAELCLFGSALQRHDCSHLQFLPQSAEPGASGRDINRVRQVSFLVDQSFTGNTIFFRGARRFSSMDIIIACRPARGKLTAVITAQYRDCISRTLAARRGWHSGDLVFVTGVTCGRQGSGS